MPHSPRVILHVDMDAFFAAVEQRDDPSLRGRPVLVGGVHRGVVAAASYEARRFGIHSAMPMATARRRCPEAVVVRGRIGHYRQVSRAVFAIFRRFTPEVEGLSLDEAFLDVSGSTALLGSGREIGASIRQQVLGEVGLTASAGVAPSKFVAKVVSQRCKPDGLAEVGEAQVGDYLAPLPVGAMWGVGEVAEAALRGAGVHTLGQLRAAPDALMARLFGRRAPALAALAWGIDPRPVVPGRPAKSVGAEQTLSADVSSSTVLGQVLLDLALQVSARLWLLPACGRQVTLKLTYADFQRLTRQTTLADPVCDADSIHRCVVALLAQVTDLRRSVRLCGVSVGGLQPGRPPPALFVDPAQSKSMAIEAVRAQVAARFGGQMLGRASLAGAAHLAHLADKRTL